jgi:renalase
MTHTPIAIIGAGVAGLAAARKLSSTDYMIFEKSRGPGGRLASKRLDQLRADIGAQFFTVRDIRFEETISLAQEAGAVEAWSPRMGTFKNSKPIDSPDTQQRYVGAPYMNAFGRFLAESIEIQSDTRVASVSKYGSRFVLTTTAGEKYTADQVLVTAPVDQMSDLLSDFDINPIADKFTMEPTWTTVVSTSEQLIAIDGKNLDAYFGGDHPTFDFISVEQSKPGRYSDFVVIHSTPEWSKVHLEEEPDSVAHEMARMLNETFKIQSRAVVSHRWRYARPTDPTLTTQKGVFQVDSGLWIAGDYLAGGRVEGSFLAGIEAAARLEAN